MFRGRWQFVRLYSSWYEKWGSAYINIKIDLHNEDLWIHQHIDKAWYTAKGSLWWVGRGSNAGGRGQFGVGGAAMWLDRGSNTKKLTYQLILGHPKFHVTDISTFLSCFLLTQPHIESLGQCQRWQKISEISVWIWIWHIIIFTFPFLELWLKIDLHIVNF